MTRLKVRQNSLSLGILTIVFVAQVPLPGYTEELSTKSDQAPIPELELIKEEETVSIASRHEQPISQAPDNVYVITDEDIRHSGATDIPTILRRIPGLEVMQTTGAEFNVSARGNNQLGANKMLVMVDGRSIYIDVQGTMFWKLLPVTLPEIKRIEVIKGPASSVYGFNAFDGVINIITKPPEEMKGTTLQFGGGELGTISSAAIHAGTAGKLGYRLSVGHDQNQQWRNRDALAFRSNKFNVQTEYALTTVSRLTVAGGLVDSNRFDGGLAQDVISSTRPAQGYANLAYEHSNFYIRAFWNRFDATDNVQFHPLLAPFLLPPSDRSGNPTGSFSADTYNVDVQHHSELSAQNRLTYGVNYRHNTLSSNFISQYSRENRLGFFLQDEWRMTPSFTLVAGARYDLDTFIHPTLSPRVALLYSPTDGHTIRLSGSVGYRPPTLFEKKVDQQLNSIFPGPSPDLKGGQDIHPEQIISYSIGYQGWFLNHRLRLRTDLFFNHISDLIRFQTVSATVVTPENDGGSADIYGGEAGVEFLATRWLTAFANYSYQEIGQSFAGRVQRGAPRSKYNVGLRSEWDNGLNGDATFYHVGAATYPPGDAFTSLAAAGLVTIPDTRVGSYNLLSLRVAYKFWQEKAEAGYMRDAEVAISAFNSLNDTHKEHPLGDTIGSRVMGWITVRY